MEALAAATGETVEAGLAELPLDVCTSGLVLDHSNRNVANQCWGVAGDVCSYTCEEGYGSTGDHVCESGGGTFSGGSCLPIGTAVCPETWTDLAAEMVVGGVGICDDKDVETDEGMPTGSVEELVLHAQQRWSQCVVATCAAPEGSDAALVQACGEVALTATSPSSDCTGVAGCVHTPALTLVPLCDGEACTGEYEIGTTTVELQAFDSFMASSSCSFTLNVEDHEPPVIDKATCPTAVVSTKGMPAWPTLETTDNSGDVAVTASVGGVEVNESSSPTGAAAVAFTAEDASGNRASCGAVIGQW